MSMLTEEQLELVMRVIEKERKGYKIALEPEVAVKGLMAGLITGGSVKDGFKSSLNESTLRSRIARGWPVEKAILTPARPYTRQMAVASKIAERVKLIAARAGARCSSAARSR